MSENFIQQIPTYTILKLTANDIKSCTEFLQGQFTQDLNLDKHTYFTAYCNIKGKVIATLWLNKIDNGWLLFIPANNGNETQKNLTKYGRFSAINIEDISTKFNAYITNNKDLITHNADNIFHINENLFIFLQNKNNMLDTNKLTTISSDLIFIQQKIPLIDKNNCAKFFVHNLNLVELKAVDFRKGCYLGQEIVARTEFKGKVKKLMNTIYLDHYIKNSIVTGTNLIRLKDNKIIASIVNIAYINQKQEKGIALIVSDLWANKQDKINLTWQEENIYQYGGEQYKFA